MYFNPAAVVTFLRAVETQTGNQVQFELRGSRLCTDGKKILIPAVAAWDERGFRAMCGGVAHESSHVYYGSPAKGENFSVSFPAGERDRAHLAFNAVCDVADETRFARRLPQVSGFFDTSLEVALEEAVAVGVVPPRPPAAPSPWLLVAASIWLVRAPRGSLARKVFRGWTRRVPRLAVVVRLLKRAQDRSRGGSLRKQRDWKRLEEIARELKRILDEACPGTPPPTTATQDAWREKGIEKASARGGAAPTTSGTTVFHDDWKAAIEPEKTLDTDHASSDLPSKELDKDVYTRLSGPFRRTVRTMVESTTETIVEGYVAGGRLSRPYRAPIDGKCFRRSFPEPDQEAAVALLLDHSFSMASILPLVLGVARAVVEALGELRGVEVAVWRYGSWVERLSDVHQLCPAPLMGGTSTHDALREAGAWFRSRGSKKPVVLLLTDGMPSDVQASREQALAISRNGGKLFVGAVGPCVASCESVFSMAIVFDCSMPESSLQTALARIGRRIFSPS